MGLRKLVKKYKGYEKKEIARRGARKRKLKAYKALKPKKVKIKLKRKFSKIKFTKAIGNPYRVKL